MIANIGTRYLFVDFYESLTKPSTRSMQYTTSLSAQYEVIRHRLGAVAPKTLQIFAQSFFSMGLKEYSVCLPALTNRGPIKKENDSVTRVRNVFIHSEKNFADFLPSGTEVYFVGEIRITDRMTKFVVYGIELLDTSVPKFGNVKITCSAKCAFMGRPVASGAFVADFGNPKDYPTVLTPNVLNEICANACPLSDYRLTVAQNNLKEYDEYLNFREYYLKTLRRSHEKLHDVAACNSYIVPRSVYDSDIDRYSDNILDRHDKLIGSDQVVLNQKIGDAEAFPLIRIDIYKNKKKVEEGRKSSNRSKYHSWLYNFSRDSVKIGYKPSNNEQDKSDEPASYRLGERYAIFSEDKIPDCADLDQQFEIDYEDCCTVIDNEYAGMVKSGIDEHIKSIKKRLDQQNNDDFVAFCKNLDDSLEKDVLENTDEAVQREFETAYNEEKSKLNNANYKKQSSLRSKITNANTKIHKVKKNSDNYNKLRAELDNMQNELNVLVSGIKENEELVSDSIKIRDFYIKRNETLKNQMRDRQQKDERREIERQTKIKKDELERLYEPEKKIKKNDARNDLSEKLDEAKMKRIEEETILCYHIYYRPAQSLDGYEQISQRLQSFDIQYLNLLYDDSAEISKFRRQRNALNDLLNGNVRNPYIATYLFAPDLLTDDGVVPADTSDFVWFRSEELNPSQKTAVKGAISNKGMYLLQGPPGTGKTEVIAEVAAQLVKQGKKVLISSETHKAIDNVFERLPKVPEIRPLRLIPNSSGKGTNYGMDNLTDNFYKNISETLDAKVDEMKSFENFQASFNEQMITLEYDYDKYLAMTEDYSIIEKTKKDLSSKISDCNIRISDQKSAINEAKARIDDLNRTRRNVRACNFPTDIEIYDEHFRAFSNDVRDMLTNFDILSAVELRCIRNVIEADINDIKQEIAFMKASLDDVQINSELAEISKEINYILGENNYEPLKPDNAEYERFKRLQSRLIELKNQSSERRDYDEMAPTIFSFLPKDCFDINKIDSLFDEIKRFKTEENDVAQKTLKMIDVEIKRNEDEIDEAGNVIASVTREKTRYDDSLTECNNSDISTEYEELKTKINNSINKFFSDYKIEGKHENGDFAKALELIKEKSENLKRVYDKNKSDYARKIPVFESISNYISQDDVKDQDRPLYTKDLYDCVNVFGITCSSSDRYNGDNNDGLKKYGIEEFDVRKIGIDVVIIDEVSKSSFLELLIPILYGKSIILVGDHKQLPPMYDLRNLHGDDFDSLDPEYITPEKNKTFTKLYETCVFKELFENSHSSYKTTLNMQYRCHSQIMNVFNFFYGENKLMVGRPDQDDKKAHNLSVEINGRKIIDPDHHVYFVNCDELEQRINGSTSIYNALEADVAVRLLDSLNDASLKLVNSKLIKASDNPKEDERPSIGIICTYGDQARRINNKRKGRKYPGFSNKQDEKLIVSTVDDFQGDERDIIIVSMVRNTTNRHINTEFITSPERINVSLSRSRKLLIILGSRRFLTSNYQVFNDIIDSIRVDGRILDSTDILQENIKVKKNHDK